MNAARLLLMLILGAGFACCSTDVDVNAPYRERAAIYALLDLVDSVHYIRIQKTFLTIQEPDFYRAAQVKDSIYYTGPDVLDVRLFLEMPGRAAQELGRLERVDTTGKDTGIFYGPDYLAYRFRGKLIREDSGTLRLLMNNNRKALLERKLRLEVRNRLTGYQARARTGLVYPLFDNKENDNFSDQYTLLFPMRIGPVREFPALRSFVRFGKQINGVLYKVMVYMPYEEVWPDGHRDTLEANWNYMPEITAEDGRNDIRWDYNSPEETFAFHDKLMAQVDITKPVEYRKLLPLKIRVLAADSTYWQYFLAGNRYSTITQTKPFYTNIENGLGLFCSRSDKTFYAVLDEPSWITLVSGRYSVMKFRR